jgi:hypothetical protein
LTLPPDYAACQESNEEHHLVASHEMETGVEQGGRQHDASAHKEKGK